MKISKKDVRNAWMGAAAALLMSSACAATNSAVAAPAAAMPAAQMSAATLSGAQQVPANPSVASGKSTIMIGSDKTLTGAIEVMGMTPTMAHIHEAAKGANGPVIVPFAKTGESTFAPAPGVKLTDAQYASYLAGKLYINVHSAAYPGGEIRLQLTPAK